MLVITRKRSEMIQIGDNVFVKVIQTGRNTVKLGIQAPQEVRVLRSELSEQRPSDPLPKVSVTGEVGTGNVVSSKLVNRFLQRGARLDCETMASPVAAAH